MQEQARPQQEFLIVGNITSVVLGKMFQTLLSDDYRLMNDVEEQFTEM